MLNFKYLPLFGFVLGLAVFGCGCGYTLKNQELSAESVVQATYTSIQDHIILPKCSQCHGGGGEDSFSSHHALLETVRVGDPEKSHLYTVVSDGSMPPLAPMLSDDEILAIYLWIKNGAKND